MLRPMWTHEQREAVRRCVSRIEARRAGWRRPGPERVRICTRVLMYRSMLSHYDRITLVFGLVNIESQSWTTGTTEEDDAWKFSSPKTLNVSSVTRFAPATTLPRKRLSA